MAYCFYRFKKNGFNVLYSDKENILKYFKYLFYPLNYISAKLIGIGFNLYWAISQIAECNKTDILFTTVDSIGLPILLLRKIRIIKTPVIYQTIGLCEGLKNYKYEKLLIKILKSLLQSASYIVSYTESEKKWLLDFMNIKPEKIFGLNSIAGVDTNYFEKITVSDDGFVLSVGADRYRDFSTLFQAASQLKEINFVVITRENNVRGLQIPSNVKLLYDLPYEDVLKYYSSARIVVLPLKENSYSMGGVVLGEVMSLGKPIIISAIEIVKVLNIQDDKDCFFVEPGSIDSLKSAILELYSDSNLRLFIGNNAKEMIKQQFETGYYVNRISQVFASI